ncbi:WYL domain-containing protein [Neptunicella sp.]|uniref:WYL domain-containing protein n=1 Tax=Neptunicella sp. TaxID=2125986 RepID=UPI003F6900C3
METSIKDEHFWLIELISYWEGGVNSSHLSQQFGVSRAQSKKYLSQYQQLQPNNLIYDASLKVFVPDSTFQITHINGDVSEYLEWLEQHNTHLVTNQSNYLTNASLNLPKRAVNPIIMRALVSAMKRQRGVDIDYMSMANPQGVGRIIYPHTFVKTGLRWHLRAYCERRGDYADFVLSRFCGEPCIEDARSQHTVENDLNWHAIINIQLCANPALNKAQQQVIEIDYQMQEGRLHIPCRAALVNYLLQEMQIDVKAQIAKTDKQHPQAHPLHLLNIDHITPYLFDREESK